jgi:pyruvate kinase
MLSAETAVGDHPDIVIDAVSRVCKAAEKHRLTTEVDSEHRTDREFQRIDEAIAMATMYTANHMNVGAIVALTESGTTPLWMSRVRSGIPIYGLCRHQRARGKMTLYRDVYPIKFDVTKFERQELRKGAIDELKQRGLVEDGQTLIVTKGDYIGIHGTSNSIKIVKVGENW